LKECSEDSTAEALYQILNEEILSTDLAKNLIGFVSDGAPVLKSEKNGVLGKISESHPYLWSLWCLCHCLAQIAIKACDAIPAYVDDFIAYALQVTNSPKKLAEFNELLDDMDIAQKKMVQLAQTRWLSMQNVCERLVYLWEPLYVRATQTNHKKLKDLMEEKKTLILIEFLSEFLEKINGINEYFQKEGSEIFHAQNQILKLYINFSNHIFRSSVNLEKRISLEIDDPQSQEENLMSVEDIYSHFARIYSEKIHLNQLKKEEALVVCQIFKEFIMNALKAFKYYLPMNDLVLKTLLVLDPDQATTSSCMDDWLLLAERFPNIVSKQLLPQFYENISSWIIDAKKLQEMRKEYVKVIKKPTSEQIQMPLDSKTTSTKLLNSIQNETTTTYFDVVGFYGSEKILSGYPILVKLSRALLVLPHSSAAVERAFSQLNIIKDDRRNRLSNETLQSLMITKINNLDFNNEELVEELYNHHLS